MDTESTQIAQLSDFILVSDARADVNGSFVFSW
jgi:hypothetical protein